MFAKYCEGKVDSEVAFDAMDKALPHAFDATRRTSVSAECWNCPLDVRSASRTHTIAGKIVQPERSSRVSKSENFSDLEMKEAYERASRSLRNTIFFEELSDKLMEVVLQALTYQVVPEDVDIIVQGDEGNELFILDEGKVEFLINGMSKGSATAGATFGELALLYNSPRAATVRTIVPCKLFSLDRVIFKRMMVAKLTDKRVHSQKLLASIEAFSRVPESLCLRISDALHPVTYKKGDVVFKEGTQGEEFYIIDEGSVSVTQNGKLVNTLSGGEYFGELALIYDLPRAATITVTSDNLKLEALSKTGFEQLIGPDLVAELRRRDPRKSK